MAVSLDDVLAQLLLLASSPHKVRGEAGQVELPQLKDAIELDKYLRGLVSAGVDLSGVGSGGGGGGTGAVSPWGMLSAKFVPPSALGG